MTGHRGSMLVVALWMLTILSMAAFAVAGRAGTDLRLMRHRWEDIRSRRAARVAAARTMAAWREDPSGAGAAREVSVGDVRVAVAPEEESNRLSLNAAPPDALRRLFAGDAAAAAAVVDWRDADDQPQPGGAEARAYADPPGPRNGPFRSVEELLWVRGMTPELFREAAPFLTVHGAGRVNLNTADRRVLEALGMTGSLAEKLLAFRWGEDRRPGTPDDGVFRSLGEVTARLAAFHLSAQEAASLSALLDRRLADVRPELWRLRLSARADDASAVRRYAAVVSPASGTILEWREEP